MKADHQSEGYGQSACRAAARRVMSPSCGSCSIRTCWPVLQKWGVDFQNSAELQTKMISNELAY